MIQYTQSRLDESKTHKDLSVFIDELYEDLRANLESWENHNLWRFPEALAASTNDMGGYHKNTGRDVPAEPKWSTFAKRLVDATIYE